MYAAKRRGGNQAGHHHLPHPKLRNSFKTLKDAQDYRSDGISA
jgi:hypothetical protein